MSRRDVLIEKLNRLQAEYNKRKAANLGENLWPLKTEILETHKEYSATLTPEDRERVPPLSFE